jgi:LPS sulfotransferase NodH
LTTERSEKASPYASDGGKQSPVFFMIFGHQRTGSTLLASRLDSHPNIHCYEEIFFRSVDSSPSMREWLEVRRLPQCLRAVPRLRASFLSSVFDASKLNRSMAAAGFKLMYDQIAWWPRFAFFIPMAARFIQEPALRSWLRKNRVLVIHVMRRNHLKILVSQKLATQNGRFHSRNPPVTDTKVFISLPGLTARLRRIELAERAARRCIEGLPTIEVHYEDYSGDSARETDVVLCKALGQDLPRRGLTSPLRKIGSDSLRDTVANYDAVAARLSGTRFERFLA